MHDPLATSLPADTNPMGSARTEAQNAVQWLARIALSYPHGRRSSNDPGLRWLASSRTVVTPEVAPHTALELSLQTLNFQFTDKGQPSPHLLDVDGKSSTEVEAWLLVEMLHRGFDRDVFSKRLPYRWDGLMSGDEVKYSPQSYPQELQRISGLWVEATDVLRQVRQCLGPAPQSPAEALDCWPETFEIGFSLPTFAQAEADDPIRVGFSLGEGADLTPSYLVRRRAEDGRPTSADRPGAKTIICRGLGSGALVQDVADAVGAVRNSAAH